MKLIGMQVIEATQTNGRSLWPQDVSELQHDFRAVSLALAACEKSVQIVYERNLRPASAQYQPWLTRVQGQVLSAYTALEQEVRARATAFDTPSHASITSAIAWQFTQSELAEIVPADQYPALAALSERLENSAEFKKYPPMGPGVQATNSQ